MERSLVIGEAVRRWLSREDRSCWRTEQRSQHRSTIERIADTSGSVHGLSERDIGGRSAGYGSPEVGGPRHRHAPRSSTPPWTSLTIWFVVTSNHFTVASKRGISGKSPSSRRPLPALAVACDYIVARCCPMITSFVSLLRLGTDTKNETKEQSSRRCELQIRRCSNVSSIRRQRSLDRSIGKRFA